MIYRRLPGPLRTKGINKYKKQIESVDDPEVVGTLKDVLDEEKAHRKEFKIRLQPRK